MSSARGSRRDEKVAFLTQNPDLIQYNTQISVIEAPVDGEDFFAPDIRDGLGQPIDGFSPEDFFDINETIAEDGIVTIASGMRLREGFLTGIDIEVELGGEDFLGGGLTGISLSDAGIGVISEDEFDVFDDLTDGEDPDLSELRAIDSGEALVFGLENLIFEQAAFDVEGPFAGGVTDLLIEYKVLNDEAGSLIFAAGNLELEDTVEQVVNIAAGSQNSTGFFEINVEEGPGFEIWALGVIEGDVEISVTDIGYTANVPELIM